MSFCLTCSPHFLIGIAVIGIVGNTLLVASLHCYMPVAAPFRASSSVRACSPTPAPPSDRLRTRTLIATLVGLLTAALAFTPLTSATYLSWDATTEPKVKCLHWVAILLHCASVLVAEALPLAHRQAVGACVLLLASIAWNSKIHILTSLLRTTAYVNDTPLFALMDLSHALSLAVLTYHTYQLRHPLLLFLTVMNVEHHLSGLVGTTLGWQSLRQTIVYLYPQTIDADALAPLTRHEPDTSLVPFRHFVPDALYSTVRELLFQSDVVGHLTLEVALAAAVARVLAHRPTATTAKHE